MIHSITLQNFQGIKKRTIKLSPTVTTIIGANDACKSATLRGIGWVAQNRPAGQAIVRRGQTLARGILCVDDPLRRDGKVSRRRRIVHQLSSGKGTYSLDGKTFAAVGRTVPGEIRKLLSLEDINFQHQHDPAFWFALSPPALARELNKLVDLTTIDQAQGNLAKQIRTTKIELDVARRRLKEAIATRQLLEPIKKFNFRLKKLDILFKRTQDPQVCVLCGIVNQVIRTRRIVSSGGQVTSQAQVLHELWQRCVDHQASIESLEGVLIDVQAAHVMTSHDIPMPNVKRIGSIIRQSAALNEQITVLDQWLKQAITHEEERCQSQRLLTGQQKRLEKKLGGRCPACFGLLSDQSPI